MTEQRSARFPIALVTIALVAWSVVIGAYLEVNGGASIATGLLGSSISPILMLVGGKPMLHWDPYAGNWPQVTDWIAGVVVILAVGFLRARGRPLRIDLVALVVWTIASWVVAFLVGVGGIACGPPPPDYTLEIEGVRAQVVCYPPWSPGFTWFGIWVVGALLIVVAGWVIRRRAVTVRN